MRRIALLSNALVCRELLDGIQSAVAVRPQLAQVRLALRRLFQHVAYSLLVFASVPLASLEHRFTLCSGYMLSPQELADALPPYVADLLSAIESVASVSAETASFAAGEGLKQIDAGDSNGNAADDDDDADDGASARAPPAVPVTRLELVLADAALAALHLLCRLAVPGHVPSSEGAEAGAADAQDGAAANAAKRALWRAATASLEVRRPPFYCSISMVPPPVVERCGLSHARCASAEGPLGALVGVGAAQARLCSRSGRGAHASVRHAQATS